LNSPETVSAISTVLTAIDQKEIVGRYNPRRMDELGIYPGNFAEDADWRSELRRDFRRLREFYSRAAIAGDGVLSWIS
jgi:hypothetical protein